MDKNREFGDKGQRYEVEGRRRSDGKWEVAGWTDKVDGGRVAEGLTLWPRYDGVRVTDRRPEPTKEPRK